MGAEASGFGFGKAKQVAMVWDVCTFVLRLFCDVLLETPKMKVFVLGEEKHVLFCLKV